MKTVDWKYVPSTDGDVSTLIMGNVMVAAASAVVTMPVAIILDAVTIFVPSAVWILIWIALVTIPCALVSYKHFNGVDRLDTYQQSAWRYFNALLKELKDRFPKNTLAMIEEMSDREARKFEEALGDMKREWDKIQDISKAPIREAIAAKHQELIEQAQLEARITREIRSELSV